MFNANIISKFANNFWVKRCIYIFHKFKSQKKCKSCAQDMTERIWFHRAKQTSNIVRNICNWSNPTRALRLFSLDAVLVRLLLSFSLLVAVCIKYFFSSASFALYRLVSTFWHRLHIVNVRILRAYNGPYPREVVTIYFVVAFMHVTYKINQNYDKLINCNWNKSISVHLKRSNCEAQLCSLANQAAIVSRIKCRSMHSISHSN